MTVLFTYHGAVGGQKGVLDSLQLESYRWLWATLWVLGAQPRYSARAASTPNFWDSSSVVEEKNGFSRLHSEALCKWKSWTWLWKWKGKWNRKHFKLDNGLNKLGSSLTILITINLFLKENMTLSTMKRIKLFHWVARRDWRRLPAWLTFSFTMLSPAQRNLLKQHY